MNSSALHNDSIQGVALSTGDATTVTLRSFGISGYVWIYEMSKNGVVQIDKIYHGDDLFASIKNKPEDTFKITAIGKGMVRIVFRQVRMWEENTFPSQTAVVEVYVV